MKRPAVIAMHVLALPAAVLVSLVLVVVLPSARGVEHALHDTYFVVAHFHASAVLGSTVAVVTLVAYACGGMNWLLRTGWGLLVVHLAAAFIPWGPPSLESVGGTVSIVPPSSPGLAHAYIASAVVGFVVAVGGLLMSAVKALRPLEARQP
jgi:heme/copper-type cytochrome/quinol oxidase subunit 1